MPNFLDTGSVSILFYSATVEVARGHLSDYSLNSRCSSPEINLSTLMVLGSPITPSLSWYPVTKKLVTKTEQLTGLPI